MENNDYDGKKASDSILRDDLTTSLPFDERQQLAFIGHVCDFQKPDVLLQVKDRIKAEWFLDAYAAKYYQAYIDFYEKFNHVPASKDEFLSSSDLKSMPLNEKLKVQTIAVKAYEMSVIYSRDVLLDELTQWMRVMLITRECQAAIKSFNERKVGQSFKILENAVKEYQDIRFEGAPVIESWDWEGLIDRLQVDQSECISTGLTLLDKKVNPNGKGGLAKGEASIWLADTNGGKSTVMQTIIKHNIMRGRNVLWYSLEGVGDKLTQMLYCGLLKVTREQFLDLKKSEPNIRQAINGVAGLIKKHLVQVHRQKSGNTVEAVIADIRSHINRFKANNDGKNFDLVVVDYPGRLQMEGMKNVKLEYRQMLGSIYGQFVDLAGEEKFHLCLPVQANREGAKETRHKANYLEKSKDTRSKLLNMTNVGESYKIAQDAPVIITINRNEQDKANNVISFYIDKSRNGETGWVVTCKTDFGRACTHSDDLGAFAYMGNDSLGGKITSILESFKNQELSHVQLQDLLSEKK